MLSVLTTKYEEGAWGIIKQEALKNAQTYHQNQLCPTQRGG